MAITRIDNRKKVFLYAPSDSCGMAFWISKALNKYSEKYQAISMIENLHPFKFPYELRLNENVKANGVKVILEQADIIQFNHTIYPTSIAGIPIPTDKPRVQYHTGFHFRNQPEKMNKLDKEHNMRIVFATPDLCRFGKHIVGLPYPIDSEETINPDRNGFYVKEKLIVHSPSDPAMKGTDIVDPVIKRVAEKFGLKVESTNNVPWEESLKLKAVAQVYVDHMYKPYNSFGISSVEAALQGTIPFAMGNDFGFRDHPFVNVNSAEELEKELNMYLAYSEKRRIKEDECKKWAEETFSLRNTVRILEEHYDKLFETGGDNTDVQQPEIPEAVPGGAEEKQQ